MDRRLSCRVLALVVAALAVDDSASQAQQAPKAPAKIAAPQTRPAAQDKAQGPAQDGGAAPQTTASVPAAGGNWRVECAGDGKTLDCNAVQQIVMRDSRQLIAGLAVRVPAETKKPVMMIQLPLGVLVSEAVEFTIDEGKSDRFSIQTCNQQGCFVGTSLAEPLLAAMQTGKQLRIVFQNANKQAVTVTMPLTGFAIAYDKVKS